MSSEGGRGCDVYVWCLLLLQVLGGSPWHTQEGDQCRGEHRRVGVCGVEGRRVCAVEGVCCEGGRMWVGAVEGGTIGNNVSFLHCHANQGCEASPARAHRLPGCAQPPTREEHCD